LITTLGSEAEGFLDVAATAISKNICNDRCSSR
jgi:hypothetical protein